MLPSNSTLVYVNTHILKSCMAGSHCPKLYNSGIARQDKNCRCFHIFGRKNSKMPGSKILALCERPPLQENTANLRFFKKARQTPCFSRKHGKPTTLSFSPLHKREHPLQLSKLIGQLPLLFVGQVLLLGVFLELPLDVLNHSLCVLSLDFLFHLDLVS